ncbi:MAG: amidohydrolase family protein, partial [Planctomycetes bacterium]|nr:amidohydrolase family protein [Planctomycetota bacterium]
MKSRAGWLAAGWMAWTSLALAGEPAADLILTNGKIVTVDRAFSVAKAMAIRGDRIIAVGSDAEALARRGSSTRVIDLAGACVLPGLIDSHCHPSSAAVAEMDHARPPMETIADVLAYFEARTEVVPKGEWIFLGQRFLTRLREHRYPTLAELDRVAPDHPVIFRTGPDCCVNSAAMKAARVGPDYVPDSKDAKVERDPATGRPTGVFRNMTGVFSRHVREAPIAPQARAEALRKMLAAYNATGLTGAGDRDVDPVDVEAYEALRARGALTVRVSIAHHLDVSGGREAIDGRLERIALLRAAREPDLWLRIRTVKSYVDGGMLTGSAFMSEPWGVSEIYNIADPAYRGLQFVPDETLALAVERAHAHGFQFVAHCQGDAGSDALVRAYEALARKTPIRAARMCIAHGSFQRLDVIRRAVKAGVVVDSQPA